MPTEERTRRLTRIPARSGVTIALLVTSLLAVIACTGDDDGPPTEPMLDAGDDEPVVRPRYDDDGALVRPDDWQTWVFLGSSLDLSYSPGGAEPPASHLLSTVYLEPTAYRHFRRTGTFREGTMTVLAAYSTLTPPPPATGGIVPGELVAFEMSVKDSNRVPEAWAYYGFGSGDTARPHSASACFACHDEHAQTDHVFTQFYPALRAD